MLAMTTDEFWEQAARENGLRSMTTAAAIDRLVHHSIILELNIPSYRMEEAKKTRDPPTEIDETN